MSLMLAKSWSETTQAHCGSAAGLSKRCCGGRARRTIKLLVGLELDVLGLRRAGAVGLAEKGVERIAHSLDLLDLGARDPSVVQDLSVRRRDLRERV